MTNKQKYQNAFIKALGLPEESLKDDLMYNTVAQWDSVGHMELITVLEEEFGIMIDNSDIFDLNSYGKGMSILAKYNIEF